MKYPFCIDSDLLVADRQGVEIDYCPKCRGVWLDRGELDKVIEHSLGAIAQPTAHQPAVPSCRGHDGYPVQYYEKHGRYYHHARRKFCPSEMFD